MAEASSQGQAPPPPLPPRENAAGDHEEDAAGEHLLPSHGIEINVPTGSTDRRPLPVTYLSAPAYASPIRHYRRVPSRSRAVKETTNAQSHYGSQDDNDNGGTSVHRINQYVIKQEIGRGSYGAVHLAVDQYGTEYAVKEFSKSRLRKRAQSNLLRQPDRKKKASHFGANLGFNSPLHRIRPSDRAEAASADTPFELIKEEIAIMKKLNHHNVVSLIEVLDDPEEDTLYMVLEMCKKGIIMKVGLDERAEPYTDEVCRTWFRDMILGIEYLHAQGIIHRDIKPDNCLVTEEGVLKIVDFGVSEMFEKSSPMETSKSAGSPAFMPPELCVAKHGNISGRPADIWSMGVTLYCLRYGHIPFERSGLLELYDCIRDDPLRLDGERDEHFADLMRRVLEKDPERRITMPDLREHPWVTKNGTDRLLPEEENCAEIIEPPTQSELNRAITGNMANLMVVMKAVKRFKAKVARKRPFATESMLGKDIQLVAPPGSMVRPRELTTSRSIDVYDRRPVDAVLAAEGVHRNIEVNDNLEKLPLDMDHVHVAPAPLADHHSGPKPLTDGSHDEPPSTTPVDKLHASLKQRATTFPLMDDHAKGHAHDPLEDQLFLRIGAGGGHYRTSIDSTRSSDSAIIVSESPPGIEESIYEEAYQQEMKRILEQRGENAAMYLNRRVDHREDLKSARGIVTRGRNAARTGLQSLHNSSRFSDIVKRTQTELTPMSDGVKSKVGPPIEAIKNAAAPHVDALKRATSPHRAALRDARDEHVADFKEVRDQHVDAFKEAHAQVRKERAEREARGLGP